MLNGSPSAKRSSVSESRTASSTKHQSSETLTISSSPVRLKNTRDMSTWLRRDFPAHHSAMRESKRLKTTRGTSGRKRSNVYGMFDLDSRSWRTSSVCFHLGTSRRSSPTLPKRGSMSSGLCWEPTTWEPPTTANDSGYWPTPTVAHVQWGNHDEPVENYLKRVKDYEEGRTRGKPGKSLGVAVRLWPTPRSSEWKDCGPVGSKSHSHMDQRFYLCAKAKDPNQPTGKLNPTWVEWLMGWPIGATGSEPLAMDKFRQWLQAHGKF